MIDSTSSRHNTETEPPENAGEFCGFFWIKDSGVPIYRWLSDAYYNMKWNSEDLFFSGFFSALTSSGQIFFDGDIVRYVEFEMYKLLCEQRSEGNIFILITTKECSDSIANTLMKNILSFFNANKFINPNPTPALKNSFRNHLYSEIKEIVRYTKEIRQSDYHVKENIESDQKENSHFETSRNPDRIHLTDQQILEARITELELQLGTLIDFSRTVGHHLNNVMASILGNVSLAKLDLEKDNTVWGSLDSAERSCERSRELTDQLLRVARNIGKKPESTFDSINIIGDFDHKMDLSIDRLQIGSGKILVLDDGIEIRIATKKMLERLNYTVDTVANLQNALHLYQRSMIKGEKYDAVILDLSELGPLGSFGSLIWLKMDPKIKAIVSSGYAKDPVFEQYLRYGFQGVLEKPYNIQELSAILYRSLDEKKEHSK